MSCGPFVVEKYPVGLDRVQDLLTWPLVLRDQINGAPEKRQAHQGRLAALPRNIDLRIWLRRKQLPDVGLEHIVGHPQGTFPVKPVLAQKEAVLAVEIAVGAGRLGQQVKCHRLLHPVLHGSRAQSGLARRFPRFCLRSCRNHMMDIPQLQWYYH